MLEHVQNMSQVFQKPKITKQKNQVAPKVTPGLGETKNAETIKEILESFLFCMYLGSFTLPLYKGAFVVIHKAK